MSNQSKKVELSTFYFARFHINRKLDYYDESEKKTWMENKLMNYFKIDEVKLEKPDKNYTWYFGGIQKETNLIIGKLGRVRKTKLKTYYDKNKKDFVEKIGNFEDGSYSYFFLDLERLILIFERKHIIGQNQFENVFCNGFKLNYDEKVEMNIDFLKDKRALEKIVNEASKITSIKFSIRPTNPDCDIESRLMDEELKKIHAKKGKITFENKENGLKIEPNTLTKSAIALCDRGYGDYDLHYTKDENDTIQQRFSSKKKPAYKDIERPTSRTEAVQIAKTLIKLAYEILDG